MPGFQDTETVTLDFDTDADATPKFAVGDAKRGSVQTPAALDGTGTTTLGFHVSNDGTNFTALQDAAGDAVAAVAVSVSAIEHLPIPAEVFAFMFCKIVLGDAQTADRDFLVFRAGD